MRIITKHGDNIQLDNNALPESIKDWTCEEASIIQDNVKLKKCWLVIVQEKDFTPHSDYEFVEQKIFDYEPTEDDLLFLLSKHSLFCSIVSVNECYRAYEE